MKLTDDQLGRLQAQKPDFTSSGSDVAVREIGLESTSWLISVNSQGLLEIRSLPEMVLVFSSYGLFDAVKNIIDNPTSADAPVPSQDVDANMENSEEDPVAIENIILAPLGLSNPRPYLIVTLSSGQLLAYEAQPRFTLDTASSSVSRRSLAVRFYKVFADTVSNSRIGRGMIPFHDTTAGLCGVFVTGSSPFWLVSSESEAIRCIQYDEAVSSFACQGSEFVLHGPEVSRRLLFVPYHSTPG